jgi:hypothetical protein
MTIEVEAIEIHDAGRRLHIVPVKPVGLVLGPGDALAEEAVDRSALMSEVGEIGPCIDPTKCRCAELKGVRPVDPAIDDVDQRACACVREVITVVNGKRSLVDAIQTPRCILSDTGGEIKNLALRGDNRSLLHEPDDGRYIGLPRNDSRGDVLIDIPDIEILAFKSSRCAFRGRQGPTVPEQRYDLVEQFRFG